MRLAFLITLLLVFTVWSTVITVPEGASGLFALLRGEPWGRQIFVDLCIALNVSWAWLFPEARARGINPWPYFLATPLVGSIAPLAFLVHRELRLRAARPVAAVTA